jgi:hypothetical protein
MHSDFDRHQIYFDIYHPQLPMIHKLRYYASLDRAPHMRPPICLRYAMWTMAASLSDKYKAYEDILYERSRKYIDAAEMKVGFVVICNIQLLIVIGTWRAVRFSVPCSDLEPHRYFRGEENLLLTCMGQCWSDDSYYANAWLI